MRGAPLAIAVLVSGRGTNMVAIARACRERRIDGRIVAVVADRPEAGAIGLARDEGLEASIVHHREFASRDAFESRLARVLADARAELVALAGFMRILSAPFVAARAGSMLNIHPSLLPRHRGLGTHRRVLEAGESEHGASVHFVTAELDGGPVVLQSRVSVRPEDTETSLSARVQATEHIIYPRVIEWIAAGRLVWRDGGPVLDGSALPAPIVEEFR